MQMVSKATRVRALPYYFIPRALSFRLMAFLIVPSLSPSSFTISPMIHFFLS